MLTLVLGGARSGKSRFAEQLAEESGDKVIYIATAMAGDQEMHARIDRHQKDRPRHWQTVEEPVKLATALATHAAAGNCLLVDCLTLWLSNVLFDSLGDVQEKQMILESSALLSVLNNIAGQVILVSNEVGSGVVPVGAMTRRYVDEAGRLHQQLARISDRVVLVTAGLAQILK